MRIYLDIDGTLITKNHQPANGLYEFLQVVTKKHTPLWLTTHCRHGDTSHPLSYLKPIVDDACYALLEKTAPTTWDMLKTEAIDFTQPFLWLDDYCMEAEKDVLAKHGVADAHILIDLAKNPEQLYDIKKILEHKDVS